MPISATLPPTAACQLVPSASLPEVAVVGVSVEQVPLADGSPITSAAYCWNERGRHRLPGGGRHLGDGVAGAAQHGRSLAPWSPRSAAAPALVRSPPPAPWPSSPTVRDPGRGGDATATGAAIGQADDAAARTGPRHTPDYPPYARVLFHPPQTSWPGHGDAAAGNSEKSRGSALWRCRELARYRGLSGRAEKLVERAKVIEPGQG